MDYYKLSVRDTLSSLKTSLNGLSGEEAKNRLKEFGSNEIKHRKPLSAVKIFLKQFIDPIVFILIVAILISFFIGEKLDAIAISVILLLNAMLGFVQEYKAEKAILLLKKIVPYKAKVIRDGKLVLIDTKLLVPGDVVVFEQGDRMPADARLIKCSNLALNESMITGESVPVSKNIGEISKKVEIGDEANMVFSGTIITKGSGRGVVTATGMNSEIGKIAHLVKKIEDTTTPLQKKLAGLSKVLGISAIFISILVILVGLNIGFLEIFRTSLSLAVSLIPEGLPAVVTITLAIGVQKMLKKKALVRKLKSVETLGEVTVICSDKTGTITKNEMEVTRLFVNGVDVKVGKGFYLKGKKVGVDKIKRLLSIAVSCNHATETIGDPTEKALFVMGKKGGVEREEIIAEIPFNSVNKFMITKHKNGLGYVKGAPENVLGLCDYIEIGGKVRGLTNKDVAGILEKNKEMASSALRVLGFAYRKNGKAVFVGLAGMIDPPAEGVKDAIDMAGGAGIRVVMITGDHMLTAEAIAKEVGISGKVMEGKHIGGMSDDELRKVVRDVGIYARVNPEHKVKILKALQENGEIVAMTGDGINDAPALKKADVGVAMSLKGTDVARESADIVLIDDNFSTIISAVKEGRKVYDNIRKFVKFLLSANIDEVLVILAALLMKLPLPMLPLQILWINLVTDSLPALALSEDKASRDIMRRKPRNPKESILSGLKGFVLMAGVLGFIATFGAFLVSLNGDIARSRTICTTTAIIFEMFFVFSCRSNLSLLEFNVFNNKYLVYAVLGAIGVHLIALYSPLGGFLGLVPLGIMDWVLIVGLALIGFVSFETVKLVKYFVKKRKKLS